jgi:hypothetical protein
MRELVQRREQVDRATRPIVAAAVELCQRVADVRAKQVAHLRCGRFMLRPARVGMGRERRGENRLRDRVARSPSERRAITHQGRVDGVAKWPQEVAAHRSIVN